MANEDMTVEEKLRALYDLQLIDSHIDRIKDLRGELPLEVEDLETSVSDLEKKIEKMNEEIKGLKTTISGTNQEIKSCEDSISKYEVQLKNVKNNREFTALTSELEYKGLEIESFQKNIKKIKGSIDFKKISLTKTQEELVSRKDILARKQKELDDLVNETESEVAKLTAESEKLESKVGDDRLLRGYKRIRISFKNGLAVVPVIREASAGSFFTIPPQRRLEIAQRKKIILDEHSGRILVDAALAAEEEEKIAKMIAKIK